MKSMQSSTHMDKYRSRKDYSRRDLKATTTRFTSKRRPFMLEPSSNSKVERTGIPHSVITGIIMEGTPALIELVLLQVSKPTMDPLNICNPPRIELREASNPNTSTTKAVWQWQDSLIKAYLIQTDPSSGLL